MSADPRKTKSHPVRNGRRILPSKKPIFTITSAALQDKLTRDLCLSDPISPKKQSKKKAKNELTLAQRMGVEKLPPPPTTEEEWHTAHRKSALRSDCKHGCPICQDDFKLKTQVLLSCGHVFHAACLKNCEKFSRKRCCPLCRTSNYEKRKIDDGAHYWKLKCYTTVQSWWRYIIERKRFEIMMETIEPKSPSKKHQFYLRKFSKMNANIETQVNTRVNAVDSFLDSLDATLATTRSVFAALEEKLVNDKSYQLEEEKRMAEKDNQTLKNGQTWKEVRCVALERNESECPICMDEIYAKIIPNEFSDAIAVNPDNNTKQCSLLSCTHVFHATCLSSFEKFSLHQIPLCPICRSEYTATKY